MNVKVIYNGPLEAPINKNDVIAKLEIYFKDENLGSYDVLALESVKRQNIFSRFMSSLNFLIWGDA